MKTSTLSVCVFCGARSGDDPDFAASARATGRMLAARNCRVVYGGGSVGMMGHLADAALKAGGQVIGVIPEALATVELMHTGVTEMLVTGDMHERKARMHQLSDAYLVLPGGVGSMEELFEVITWRQLAFHDCPIALFNQNGYYDGLIMQLDRMMSSGFLPGHHDKLLQALTTVEQLAEWIQALRLPEPPAE